MPDAFQLILKSLYLRLLCDVIKCNLNQPFFIVDRFCAFCFKLNLTFGFVTCLWLLWCSGQLSLPSVWVR